MSVATNVIAVKHLKDPKRVILDDLDGWLDKIHPTAKDCVICVYERPETTAGGIIMPETSSRRAEDRFQGVVGLIVKTGPNFAKGYPNLGMEPKVGDWVAFRTQDCVSFVLGKRSMRLIQSEFIRMVLTDPDCVL